MFFQITLIKSGWNELMILGSAFRSVSLNDGIEGIMMGQGKVVTMEDAHRVGLGEIFDRVLVELVGKMEEMKMVIPPPGPLQKRPTSNLNFFIGKMRIGLLKGHCAV